MERRALLLLSFAQLRGGNDTAEITTKYLHAVAVVQAWDKWQHRLFERANLIELRPERAAKLRSQEHDAGVELIAKFSQFARLFETPISPRRKDA